MRLLVVEDEPHLGALLTRGLQEEGHGVDLVTTVAQARARQLAVRFDLIVLDWMLPDGDGLTLLEGWRAAGMDTPVIMLSARTTVPERVLSLRSGADDYLPKPFDLDELLARVEALARRAGVSEAQDVVGDVRWSRVDRRLSGPAGVAELTTREAQLWSALLARRGEAVTRAELITRVWGPDFDGEPNVVDVYVGYLRAKLDSAGAVDVHIKTVRGLGYRLEVAAR